MTQSYRELIAWNKGMELVTEVYRVTQNFQKEVLSGLMCQLRRTAVSIPSNIAEGQGRLSKEEFRGFLGNARGSLCELETQILIAQNLNYIDQQEASILVDLSSEIGRILMGL